MQIEALLLGEVYGFRQACESNDEEKIHGKLHKQSVADRSAFNHLPADRF
jgi:hypothetical protein